MLRSKTTTDFFFFTKHPWPVYVRQTLYNTPPSLFFSESCWRLSSNFWSFYLHHLSTAAMEGCHHTWLHHWFWLHYFLLYLYLFLCIINYMISEKKEHPFHHKTHELDRNCLTQSKCVLFFLSLLKINHSCFRVISTISCISLYVYMYVLSSTCNIYFRLDPHINELHEVQDSPQIF